MMVCREQCTIILDKESGDSISAHANPPDRPNSHRPLVPPDQTLPNSLLTFPPALYLLSFDTSSAWHCGAILALEKLATVWEVREQLHAIREISRSLCSAFNSPAIMSLKT
jgi:hypothetical protein